MNQYKEDKQNNQVQRMCQYIVLREGEKNNWCRGNLVDAQWTLVYYWTRSFSKFRHQLYLSPTIMITTQNIGMTFADSTQKENINGGKQNWVSLGSQAVKEE